MGDGPPGFRPGFTCLVLLGDRTSSRSDVGYGTVTLCRAAFLPLPLPILIHVVRPTTPSAEADGLGYFLFARHYSGNRGFFLFHRVLRCVSSPGLLGNPGINARLTASPGFSQPSTPFRLLTPRHPPHALSSLTTMILAFRRPASKLTIHCNRCLATAASSRHCSDYDIVGHHTCWWIDCCYPAVFA